MPALPQGLSGVSPTCQGSLNSDLTRTLITPSCTNSSISAHTQPWGSHYGKPWSFSFIDSPTLCHKFTRDPHTHKHWETLPTQVPLLHCPAQKILVILTVLNFELSTVRPPCSAWIQIRKLSSGKTQGQSWGSFHEF